MQISKWSQNIFSSHEKYIYFYLHARRFLYDIFNSRFFFKVCMCGIMYKCAKYSPLVSLAHFHTEIYEVIFFKEENACSLDVCTYITIFYNAIYLIFFHKNFWYCRKMLHPKNIDPHKVIICPFLYKISLVQST